MIPRGALLDLTLHPVAPEFVADTFRRWVAAPPRGMGAELHERLELARVGLAGAAPPRPDALPLLEVALGTALAHYEVYWLERSCGLRALSREEPALAPVLRHPLELLAVTFPEAPRLGAGQHSVWIPGDRIAGLREVLRSCAGELRELLHASGVATYLAALVEATGYCLDRGFGLLELEGVADLTHLPNRASCRAFFDRPGPAEVPLPVPRPAAEDASAELLIARAEEALEEGDEERAREPLRQLRLLGEDGSGPRLLLAWLQLLEGEAWNAGELLEDLEEPALPPALAVRLPALQGWALLDCGDAEQALPHLLRALELEPGNLDLVERLGLAAIRAGDQLEAALQAVRSGLTRLTPPRLLSRPPADWLADPEEADRLPEPERFASLLALLGQLHALLGFPEHAESELEQALALDGDLPWARRWLSELRQRG